MQGPGGGDPSRPTSTTVSAWNPEWPATNAGHQGIPCVLRRPPGAAHHTPTPHTTKLMNGSSTPTVHGLLRTAPREPCLSVAACWGRQHEPGSHSTNQRLSIANAGNASVSQGAIATACLWCLSGCTPIHSIPKRTRYVASPASRSAHLIVHRHTDARTRACCAQTNGR